MDGYRQGTEGGGGVEEGREGELRGCREKDRASEKKKNKTTKE